MLKLLFIITLLCSSTLFADDLTIVAIGDAEKEADSILFTRDSSQNRANEKFVTILENDFGFYRTLFKVVAYSAEKKDKLTSSSRFIVELKFKNEGAKVVVIALLKDTLKPDFSFSKDMVLTKKNVREDAHHLANDIYQAITGKESIFLSKMIFVSDRGSTRKNVIKELYQADFDGGNVKRITYHRGFVISPSVSNDGTKVLYSLISSSKRNKKRNLNLRLYDLKTKKDSLVSSRRGINSGAVFLEGDKDILLTLSIVGNAEIYKMSLKTRQLTRITKNYAQDVDPSMRADGKRMTFLSNRSGSAMIYTLDPSAVEKDVRRISFVGKFNATPRFSPEGSEIAFSSWIDNRFDIFRIGVDGNNLVRLTKDFGSNEDPTYSPDGRFIAFSSQKVISRRKISQNIYIMDREGTILGNITSKFGKCITPRWSK